jgi:hypothetical protein
MDYTVPWTIPPPPSNRVGGDDMLDIDNPQFRVKGNTIVDAVDVIVKGTLRA